MIPESAIERQAVRALLDGGDAEAAWARFSTVPEPTGPDLRLLRKIAWSQRLPERQWELSRILAQREDESPSNAASTARSALRAGDREGALELVDLALGVHPDHPELLRVRAEIRIRLGHGAEALDPWLAGQPSAEDRLAAVDLLVEAGAIDRARSLAATLEGPGARRWQAHFALWTGDHEAVRAHLPHLDGTEAQVLEGALAVLEDRPADALPPLDAALTADPRLALAHQWRSEALLRLDRPTDAVLAADAAMRFSRRPSLPARILRCLAMQAESPRSAYLQEALRPDLLEPLAPIVGEDPPKTADTLERALAAFAGNRSETPTVWDDGGLHPLVLPADPRHRARRGQAVLKVRGPSAARAAIQALVAAEPDDPMARTHLGELELWCGAYGSAREAFEAALALDDTTRWAWVGLGACALLTGDPDQALAHWQHCIAHTGAAGPTLFAYRAECQRQLGNLDEADRDLAAAARTEPRRLGTWLNRALVAAARGDARPAQALATHLKALCPPLVGEGPAPEQLEQVLVRLRGNRSSSLVTWFDEDGQLRLLPWAPPKGV